MLIILVAVALRSLRTISIKEETGVEFLEFPNENKDDKIICLTSGNVSFIVKAVIN